MEGEIPSGLKERMDGIEGVISNNRGGRREGMCNKGY